CHLPARPATVTGPSARHQDGRTIGSGDLAHIRCRKGGMMAGNTAEPGASSLARGLAVLECFDASEPALTITEIAARTDLPVSTAHRLVTRLVDSGMLEPATTESGGRRVCIGRKVWEIGLLADVGLQIRECALPFMVDLYE